jgi:hypothetical protein
MASPALPLNLLVNVSTQTAAQQAVAPLLNQELIIGSSARIPSVGANSRVRQYSSLAGMTADGFLVTDPEYIAAQILLSQSPAPITFYIGRQNLTALNAFAIAAAGTVYAVGDTFTVAGGTAGKLAIGQVTAISGGGGTGPVTGIALVSGGDGYTAGVGVATTALVGAGTGLTVTTTGDIGETPLIAVQACRAASPVWWGVMVTGSVTADHEAIAAYVEAMQPVGAYFYTTSDNAVLVGAANNVGAFLRAAGYKRDFGVYATTQAGAAPNNIYAAAAALGVMGGLNTGLANSSFTMMFKQLVGILPELITSSQRTTILAQGINVYDGYANTYTILESGQTPQAGTYIDQILNRDILVAALQFGLMNLLVGTPSVPQTDPGQTQLIHAVNVAAQAQVTRGYLAGGTWLGPQILNLSSGDPLPNGYLTQSPSYATQSQADKNARKSMPIYLAIIEAGSVQSIVVGVYIH